MNKIVVQPMVLLHIIIYLREINIYIKFIYIYQQDVMLELQTTSCCFPK